MGKVGSGPVNKWLNFGGKYVIHVRIATLVRRALAEVCTVAVFLVFQCTDAVRQVTKMGCGLENPTLQLSIKVYCSDVTKPGDSDFVFQLRMGFQMLISLNYS